MALVGDDWIVHGGFAKQGASATTAQQPQNTSSLGVSSETKVHTDAWILHLKPLLKGKPPVWERLTNSMPASQLPGFVQKQKKQAKSPASPTVCLAN